MQHELRKGNDSMHGALIPDPNSWIQQSEVMECVGGGVGKTMKHLRNAVEEYVAYRREVEQVRMKTAHSRTCEAI